MFSWLSDQRAVIVIVSSIPWNKNSPEEGLTIMIKRGNELLERSNKSVK